VFNSMAPPANLFALLNDDVEDGRKDIEVAVAVREEEKKVEATEKKKESQKKKTEKKKKERSCALNQQKKTYLRAKRLVLPASVIRSQIIVRKDKPEEALSQIVKDNPEEEGQDGKTAPSNAAAQNHNNGGRRDRRDYGRANGGNGRRNIPLKFEENNNGEILVDEEGFQMVRSRRSNGGNGRRNTLKENNNGEILVDKEGFQMVRSWRRRNGQTNLFNENNSKSTEAAVLLETNQESGKYVESNGESEKKPAADVEKKNSNEENRADNGKGKRPPSNSNKGRRFDKSLEEKKKNSNEENRSSADSGKGKRTSEVKKSLEEEKKKSEDEVKVYYTLKEYESRLQKMKGGSPPGEAAKEMRTSNNIRKEEESLDKVLKFKFVYPVRDIPTRRRWSDEVEKESSQQPREPVPVPEPEPEPEPEPTAKPEPKPEPVPVPGLDQFPELSKKRSP
jgi:hypothetical protein